MAGPPAALSLGTRSEPPDMSHHYNSVTRERVPSVMKGLYKYFLIPGMGNLAGGFPFPGYFPFDTLEASVSPPSRFTAAAAPADAVVAAHHRLPLLSRFAAAPPSPTRISVPKYSTAPLPRRLDLATALQYSLVTGLAPLASFISTFTARLHPHIPYAASTILTCGNTDGLSKTISVFGEHGDSLLVEEYTYPAAIQTAAPFGINVVPVRMDDHGLVPAALQEILATWDPARGRRPHLLYTITVGQNPTGATIPLARRKELYALCVQYDILLIEDDPYYFIQFTTHDNSNNKDKEGVEVDFLSTLTPSFLSIDTTARVIRLDTFSKTLAPGCRLGWITAQPALIQQFAQVAEVSTQAPSGLSQAMVAALLSQWGMDGWVRWLQALRDAYQRRMTQMCRVLREHQDLVVMSDADGDAEDAVVVRKCRMYSFVVPAGGMFVWAHVHITAHPAYAEWRARGRSRREMMTVLWAYVAETQLALPAPGWVFATDERGREGEGAERLRFCFAAVEEEEVGVVTGRWGVGVARFWALGVAEIVEWEKRMEEVQVQVQGVVMGMEERGVVY